MIYDNVAAIVDNDGKHGQLNVGTLIQIGTGWRAMDLPKSEAGDGFFFTAILTQPQQPETPGPGGLDEKMQRMLSELEATDKGSAFRPRRGPCQTASEAG